MRGARHFSELLIWKLADELRIEIFKLTSRPAFVRDLKAHSQAEDAANSVCRNIAEGFGCETHREFARFLSISRRSLNELQDSLRGAELKQYCTTADCVPARLLFRRLYPAMNRLLAYLRRTPEHGRAKSARTDQRKCDADPRSDDRTGPRSDDRTNSRSRDRTDKRKGDRTDPRSDDRTDPR